MMSKAWKSVQNVPLIQIRLKLHIRSFSDSTRFLPELLIPTREVSQLWTKGGMSCIPVGLVTDWWSFVLGLRSAPDPVPSNGPQRR